MKTLKVAIVGLGGVGGVMGAKLAKRFEGSQEAQVCFLARGETLSEIQKRGFILEEDGVFTTAVPFIASDSAEEIGVADYLVYATKTYDLDSAISSIRPLVGKGTVIIPFCNGVEAEEKFRAAFPDNITAHACVFIVAQKTAPASVRSSMPKYRYVYGSEDASAKAQLERFELLLNASGVKNLLSADAAKIVWEKFALISPLATATSFTDKTYGALEADAEAYKLLEDLTDEFCKVALALGAKISPTLAKDTLEAMRKNMPKDATTSMQRDFRAKQPTELDTLTGYMVRAARRLGIDAPAYEKTYAALLKKASK